jgi:hypothetical protein
VLHLVFSLQSAPIYCADVQNNIQSPSHREEEEEVGYSGQSSTYTGRPNSPLVKEETPLLKHINIYERIKICGSYTQCSLHYDLK